MKVRALITMLLVLALGATHAAAGARFAERDGERQQLAAEEEREAREFVEVLIGRLEREQDFAPLVRDQFVGDYAERLHASLGAAGSLYSLDRTAAAEATREEVLRYQVAVNNLLLLNSLYAASPDGLPPDARAVIESEPLLARFTSAGEGREAAGEDEFITTAARLRALTATAERANELLRQRLTDAQKRRAFGGWRRAAEANDETSARPRASVVGQEWYGYPAGTRIVCVTLLLFHVELVRVGNAYKVLSVYLNDD